MPCEPKYDYRPRRFVASPQMCVAPLYVERRARRKDGGAGSFFRYIVPGTIGNKTTIEFVQTSMLANSASYDVFVNHPDYPQESYTVTQTWTDETETESATFNGGFGPMRSVVNSSSQIIQMPARGTDFYDPATQDPEGGQVPPEDTPITPGTYRLLNGSGPPTDASLIDTIRTGPGRTLAIIRMTEALDGTPSYPSWIGSDRVTLEWNGTDWVKYTPNANCA